MPTRGSTTQRGYGWQHQQLRAQTKRDVDAGQANCWRCGQHIQPGQPWDLGHDDTDRNTYRGPEHRGRECPAGGNRATSGRTNKRETSPRRWNL